MECVGTYVFRKFGEYLLKFLQLMGFESLCFFEELSYFLLQLSVLIFCFLVLSKLTFLFINNVHVIFEL
jgi:hypothetical protein